LLIACQQYLGPSAWQLFHLFLLILVNSFALFALSILLVRTLWSLAANVTAIESWEIERHKSLLRRARHVGGYLDGPDGIKVKIEKQEFPYDIGIWENIKAGMGGNSNVSYYFLFFSNPTCFLHFI
jgi:palmitoyltransferase